MKAWKKLHRKPDAFLHARNGDHVMIPFECDGCIYRKLRGKNPPKREEDESTTDSMLLAWIRCANLDAFWSLASSTVEGNARKMKLVLKFSTQVELSGPYHHTEALPSHDYCGYEVAIQMLLNSIRPGKNNPKYTQFDTIRKIRTGYSNFIRASNQANSYTLTMNDQGGRYQRISSDACGSLWFKKFLKGCQNRMGQEWMPNKAFNTPLPKRFIREVEDQIAHSTDEDETHEWIVFSAYITTCYVISLRGNEGFLLDLDGLVRHWTKAEQDHIIFALLGTIKGEHHDLAHLIPCTNKTSSGIPVRNIIERLIKHKRKLGFVDGPAISDSKGILYSSQDMNDKMLMLLLKIYDELPDLFPVEIAAMINKPSNDREVILKKYYSVFRTLRRSSNSRALEMNDFLKQDDIDIVNRWRSKEKANGKRPNHSMKQHYAEVSLLLRPFLRYTKAT